MESDYFDFPASSDAELSGVRVCYLFASQQKKKCVIKVFGVPYLHAAPWHTCAVMLRPWRLWLCIVAVRVRVPDQETCWRITWRWQRRIRPTAAVSECCVCSYEEENVGMGNKEAGTMVFRRGGGGGLSWIVCLGIRCEKPHCWHRKSLLGEAWIMHRARSRWLAPFCGVQTVCLFVGSLAGVGSSVCASLRGYIYVCVDIVLRCADVAISLGSASVGWCRGHNLWSTWFGDNNLRTMCLCCVFGLGAGCDWRDLQSRFLLQQKNGKRNTIWIVKKCMLGGRKVGLSASAWNALNKSGDSSYLAFPRQWTSFSLNFYMKHK